MIAKKYRTTIKWVLYTAFALLLFLLQCAPQRLGIFSDVLFMMPFAIAVSCYEKIIPSAIIASLCGLFWDYSAQRAFGFHALFMCIICVAVSLLMKFYVRPVYVSAAAAVSAAVLIYCLVDFFFFYALRSYENIGSLFASDYLPTFFKTCVFGLGILYVVEKIYRISPQRAKFDE